MARKTLAKIRIALLEEEGNLVRVNPDKLDEEEVKNVQMEDREVFLLHWGLDYERQYDDQGRLHVWQFTVGICQDKRTGQIWTCLPTEIVILGSAYIN